MLGNAVAARQLPNGNVLVNDIIKRQLVMFDPTLGTTTIIADSVSGGANSYGPSAGALTGFFGDSLLFIDPRDLSMFVIDPTGAIARVAAVPRSQDAGAMGSNVIGAPALDSKGRLVYRGGAVAVMMGPAGGGRGGPAGLARPMLPDFPDSTAIVRVDLATRKVDTVAYFKIPKMKMNITQTERGMSMTNEINPMPIVDDFAVVSDGSVGDRARPGLPHRLGQSGGRDDAVGQDSVRLAASERRGQDRRDRFGEDGDGARRAPRRRPIRPWPPRVDSGW